MSIINTFLPGRWEIVVDVNDFVNLNKNPSNTFENFEERQKNFSNLFTFLKKYREENELNEESERIIREKLITLKRIEKDLKEIENKQINIGINYKDEINKVSSSQIKALFKSKIIKETMREKLPPVFSPDIRQIPLYGIDRLIKEKREMLKKTEGEFQSYDWIERRLEVNVQLETLENLKLKLGGQLDKPAKSTKEVLNNMLLVVIELIKENPVITFHIPTLINFIDIYSEKDITKGVITEEYYSEMLAEFYTKLIFISENLRKKEIKFIVTETIFSAEASKTAFMFLKFYKYLGEFMFPLTVITHKETSKELIKTYDELIELNANIKFVEERQTRRKQKYSVSHIGFPYISDEEVILYTGKIDILKILYLTLNGGKDIKTNSNVTPVYQKFKDDNIQWEMLLKEFINMSSTVFTSVSELNNLIMYLTERKYQHPMRSSLKKYHNFYYYYHVIDKIYEVSELLVCIKNKKSIFKRNKNGFILKINKKENYNPEDDEVTSMIVVLSILLKEEIKKLKFYKHGKPKIMIKLTDEQTLREEIMIQLKEERDVIPYKNTGRGKPGYKEIIKQLGSKYDQVNLY